MTVTGVTKVGITTQAGPLTPFIPKSVLGDWQYEDTVNVQPCYRNYEENMVIAKDARVRVRVTGVVSEATKVHCMATVDDDYLGPIVAPLDSYEM